MQEDEAHGDLRRVARASSPAGRAGGARRATAIPIRFGGTARASISFSFLFDSRRGLTPASCLF